jgi:hypothetical protein
VSFSLNLGISRVCTDNCHFNGSYREDVAKDVDELAMVSKKTVEANRPTPVSNGWKRTVEQRLGTDENSVRTRG